MLSALGVPTYDGIISHWLSDAHATYHATCYRMPGRVKLPSQGFKGSTGMQRLRLRNKTTKLNTFADISVTRDTFHHVMHRARTVPAPRAHCSIMQRKCTTGQPSPPLIGGQIGGPIFRDAEMSKTAICKVLGQYKNSGPSITLGAVDLKPYQWSYLAAENWKEDLVIFPSFWLCTITHF